MIVCSHSFCDKQDEPTNHLVSRFDLTLLLHKINWMDTLLTLVFVCVFLKDMESIDALAKAVNEFEGGMVLVSHDMRLISQVAKEIWICDHKTITMYKGDILNFKMDMRAQMHLDDNGDKGKSAAAGKGKLRGDASVIKKSDADLEKEKRKKEAVKATSNGNGKKSSSSTLDTILAPKQRDQSEVNDAWDVQEVKSSLPQAEEPSSAPAPKKYIPPHLRNKQ